jgi:hypothetical protein
MQLGRIAYVTSQRAFSRTEETGQNFEFDVNAEIVELAGWVRRGCGLDCLRPALALGVCLTIIGNTHVKH